MTISRQYETLALSHTGRVLTVALNRPDDLNAVNHEMHEELARVFYEAADDPASDVIVLTGAGAAFCAGGDINWLKQETEATPTPFMIESRVVRKIVHGLLDCPKPVIAAVNGDAIGLGASLALLCDVIIAKESAKFADPHVRIGLVAGDGGALIWPQLIGFAKAKHFLFTGDAILAKEAERMNLITFAVPDDEFDVFVTKYTQRLERGAQAAIRYTKVSANIALRQLYNSVFETAVAYEGLAKQSGDFREGVRAYLEKRRPDFKGD